MATKFAGYREGKESAKEEKRESKGLQRFEKKKGTEKMPHKMKGGRKGC